MTSDTSGILKLQTAGTDAVTITASQNVGIGTSSPSRKLHVYGAGQFSDASGIQTVVWSEAVSGAGGVGTNNNYPFAFLTNGSERMRIDSSGNLGVGTSSPTAKVTVYNSGSGDAAVRVGNAQNGITTDVGKQGATGYGATSAGDAFLYSGGTLSIMADNASSVIKFSAGSNTERARIDSSGNLLVGTTTGSNISGQTTVFQVGSGNEYFDIGRSTANNVLQITTVTGTTSARSHLAFRNPNGQVGSIQTSGTSTSYVTSSDYRLKENIAPMTGALSVVQQLNPVTYNWKVDGSEGQGFIAHELQEVVPDCVTGAKDATRMEQYEITPAVPATYDEESNELTPAVEAVMGEREVPVYQGIDTSFLVATLTAAIKEMKEIIDQQSERITALEGAAQ